MDPASEFIIPAYLVSGSLIALFLLLLAGELFFPLRRAKRDRPYRWAINLGVTGLSFAVGTAVVRPVALGLAAYNQSHAFGLLVWIPLPFWLKFVVGFLLMDLTFYWWHRANHVYPLLWRFHNVHHVDPDLDVTTSFRFHFGETFYSTAFRIFQVGLMGITPITYLVYEFAFNVGTMFHHSNLLLPLGAERILNKIFVTPRMHGVHHSAVGPETNSNYSVVFRWWDYLHQSLRLNIAQKDIVIGVPGYLRPSENQLVNLVIMPFARQKPYWRFPSGKSARREKVEVQDPHLMVS
jgi:sterol desaturase/sphingolipid hydroxylase (fatty acid hydroxylase superfamily)